MIRAALIGMAFGLEGSKKYTVLNDGLELLSLRVIMCGSITVLIHVCYLGSSCTVRYFNNLRLLMELFVFIPL